MSGLKMSKMKISGIKISRMKMSGMKMSRMKISVYRKEAGNCLLVPESTPRNEEKTFYSQQGA